MIIANNGLNKGEQVIDFLGIGRCGNFGTESAHKINVVNNCTP